LELTRNFIMTEATPRLSWMPKLGNEISNSLLVLRQSEVDNLMKQRDIDLKHSLHDLELEHEQRVAKWKRLMTSNEETEYLQTASSNFEMQPRVSRNLLSETGEDNHGNDQELQGANESLQPLISSTNAATTTELTFVTIEHIIDSDTTSTVDITTKSAEKFEAAAGDIESAVAAEKLEGSGKTPTRGRKKAKK